MPYGDSDNGKSIIKSTYVRCCAMSDLIYKGGIPFSQIPVSILQHISIFYLTNNKRIK